MTVATVTTATIRGVGYVRVSDEGGRAGKDNFFSPVEQRETIQRFVASRPEMEIVEWIEAIDVSSKGGNNFQQPDFQAMLDRIRSGHLDAVIVPRFDRFGRDLRESLVMIEVIEKEGASVISASETTTNDAAGRLARNAFLMFANYQLDRITENWRKVHDHVHEKGRPHGAHIPLGYVRGSDGRCEVHPVYGPLMTWAFEQRAHGKGVAALVHQLQADGLPLKSHHALRHMLRNPVYLGEIHRGDRPAKINAHPALTTRETFAACQAVVKKKGSGARCDYLLTGLVRCGSCGRATSYNKALGVYRCPKGGPGSVDYCTQGASLVAAKLEPFVEAAWRERIENRRLTPAKVMPNVTDLERAHLEARADVKAWLQNTAAQRAGIDLWNEELDRRMAVERGALQALEAALAKAGGAGLDDREILRLYITGTRLERREFLRAAIEKIVIAPVGTGSRAPIEERVTITFLD